MCAGFALGVAPDAGKATVASVVFVCPSMACLFGAAYLFVRRIYCAAYPDAAFHSRIGRA